MAKIQRPSTVRRPSTVGRPLTPRRPSTSTSTNANSGNWNDNINNYLQSISMPNLKNSYEEQKPDFRDSIELSFERVITQNFNENTSMYDIGGNSSIFPGMIVRLDEKFGTNMPTEIGFDTEERAPITITSNLPGSTSFTLNPVTRKNFVEKSDLMVTDYLNKTATNGNHYLYAQWEYKEIKSEMHLKATLNAAVSSVKLDSSYNIDTSKNYLLGIYRQVYYRLELDSSTINEPSDLFTEKTNLETLKRNLNGKPAGIVKWVDYGRTFYVLFKSSKTAHDMQTALSYGSYAKASVDLQKTLEEIECNVILIGGDTKSVNITKGVSNGKNMDIVYQNIEEYSKMSKDNRGAPLSFQVNYLRQPMDMVNVISSGKTYKTTTTVKEVGIKICHDNSTITNYYIRYMNPYYNESTGALEWSYKSIKESFSAATSDKIIYIPARARFVNIVICQQGVRDKYKYSIVLDRLQVDDFIEVDGKLIMELHVTGALYDKEYKINPSCIQEILLKYLSNYSVYEDKDKAKKCFSDAKYTINNINKLNVNLQKCYSSDGKRLIVEKALDQLFEAWISKIKGF